MAGCFNPLWICIFWIRPPAKPPDKTEPINLRYRSPQLIVFCGAIISNAYRRQLIVESIAKPASFKIIVESVSCFANQIHSEPQRLHAFKIAPTDPSKAMTATAISKYMLPIGTFQQTLDSATSTMTFEPNAPSVTPTVDQSIFNGKIIPEFLALFASAKPVLFINILRESKQRNISSAKQFHGSQSRGRSNLATSIFQLTSDIPSQVCEGESYYQAPSGLREEEEMELEHCVNGNELNHNNNRKSRTREEPAIQSTLIHYSAQGRSHLVAAPATQTYWLPRETAKPPAKATSLASHSLLRETRSATHSLPRETRALSTDAIVPIQRQQLTSCDAFNTNSSASKSTTSNQQRQRCSKLIFRQRIKVPPIIQRSILLHHHHARRRRRLCAHRVAVVVVLGRRW